MEGEEEQPPREVRGPAWAGAGAGAGGMGLLLLGTRGRRGCSPQGGFRGSLADSCGFPVVSLGWRRGPRGGVP